MNEVHPTEERLRTRHYVALALLALLMGLMSCDLIRVFDLLDQDRMAVRQSFRRPSGWRRMKWRRKAPVSSLRRSYSRILPRGAVAIEADVEDVFASVLHSRFPWNAEYTRMLFFVKEGKVVQARQGDSLSDYEL